MSFEVALHTDSILAQGIGKVWLNVETMIEPSPDHHGKLAKKAPADKLVDPSCAEDAEKSLGPVTPENTSTRGDDA